MMPRKNRIRRKRQQPKTYVGFFFARPDGTFVKDNSKEARRIVRKYAR